MKKQISVIKGIFYSFIALIVLIVFLIVFLAILLIPFILAMIYSPGASIYWSHLLARTLLPFGGSWWILIPLGMLMLIVFEAYENKNFRWYAPALTLIPICMIFSVLDLWISHIVIDQMRAGGMNSNNVCALLSPGTILPALEGLVIGACLALIPLGVSHLIRLLVRKIRKKTKGRLR